MCKGPSDDGPTPDLLDLLLYLFIGKLDSAEKKGDTPDAGEANDCKYNSADSAQLSTEQPPYHIKTENTDAAPVQSTDNHQYKGQFVHAINSFK